MRSLKTWWQSRPLQTDDPAARASAVSKLAHSKDASALDALIEALADPDANVRALAANGIITAGHSAAIKPLVQALLGETEHHAIRTMIETLQSINPQLAVEALLPALDDDEELAAQTAATAIHEIGWEHLTTSQKVRVAIISGAWEHVTALGVDAVEPLTKAFRQATQQVMRSTAEALGMIDAPQASAALVKLMVDPKIPRIGREIASWALRQFRGDCLPQDVAVWVCVSEGDWLQAVDYGELAVEPLKFALNDDRRDVRQKAISTLKKIHDAKAVTALREVLCDHGNDVAMRVVAASALGDAEHQKDDCISTLVESLKDDAWGVREAAARSLKRLGWIPQSESDRVHSSLALQEWEVIATIGDAAIAPLVDALHYQSVGPAVAKALVTIGKSGTDALIAALREPNLPMSTREIIARTLTEIGDARAVEPMQALLNDPDMVVRQIAVWTLERLGWQATNDAQRASVAIANEDWEALTTYGAAAADALLSLAAQGLAPRETLNAMCELLAASAAKLTTDQLRTIASMPDLNPPGQPNLLGAEVLRASARVRTKQALQGATQPMMPIKGKHSSKLPDSASSEAQAAATGETEQIVVECAAARQLARVELSRRGIMA